MQQAAGRGLARGLIALNLMVSPLNFICAFHLPSSAQPPSHRPPHPASRCPYLICASVGTLLCSKFRRGTEWTYFSTPYLVAFRYWLVAQQAGVPWVLSYYLSLAFSTQLYRRRRFHPGDSDHTLRQRRPSSEVNALSCMAPCFIHRRGGGLMTPLPVGSENPRAMRVGCACSFQCAHWAQHSKTRQTLVQLYASTWPLLAPSLGHGGAEGETLLR